MERWEVARVLGLLRLVGCRIAHHRRRVRGSDSSVSFVRRTIHTGLAPPFHGEPGAGFELADVDLDRCPDRPGALARLPRGGEGPRGAGRPAPPTTVTARVRKRRLAVSVPLLMRPIALAARLPPREPRPAMKGASCHEAGRRATRISKSERVFRRSRARILQAVNEVKAGPGGWGLPDRRSLVRIRTCGRRSGSGAGTPRSRPELLSDGRQVDRVFVALL